MASASPLSPTFYGHIASTQDALLLFEACLSGALNHVARRPHGRDWVSLIQSGNVFIYEEHSSGIKHWSDGVPWSPSRNSGNFLVYSELEHLLPPGEKKVVMKCNKRSWSINKPRSIRALRNGVSNGYHLVSAVAAASTFDSSSTNSLNTKTELLVDSCSFKKEGLVKKTISVTVGGVCHHLISYCTVADVVNNKFITPSKDPRFQHITLRPDLVAKQSFRAPIDEVDLIDRMEELSIHAPTLMLETVRETKALPYWGSIKTFGKQCVIDVTLHYNEVPAIVDSTHQQRQHSQSYFCTFLNCDETFSSEPDWKRHENTQHFHLKIWRCDAEKVEGGICAKVCYRGLTFKEHLKRHDISDPVVLETKLNACCTGRNCQTRFWCGFCGRLINLKKKGIDAWTERYDHLHDHFAGQYGTKQYWTPMDSDKPSGQIHKYLRTNEDEDEDEDEDKDKWIKV